MGEVVHFFLFAKGSAVEDEGWERKRASATRGNPT